ncbi:MAG: DUF3105 domain-containing protein [Acidimicrobiales bacterium]
MKKRVSVILIGVSFMAAACGSGSGSSSACGTAFQEQLDPASELHILDGAEVDYLTDPPTSGPHGAVAVPEGIVGEPLSRSTQVAVLEAGRVLVQYSETVSYDAVIELTAIEHPSVVVAPNPGLDEPVVVTAWTWKMECSEVDEEVLADINAFAEERSVAAPGSDF